MSLEYLFRVRLEDQALLAGEVLEGAAIRFARNLHRNQEPRRRGRRLSRAHHIAERSKETYRDGGALPLKRIWSCRHRERGRET